MKRDVAEKVADSRKKKWQSSYRESSNSNSTNNVNTLLNLDNSPYFTHHVKDLYYKFVDQTAKLVKEKCMDEFLSTRTIYWDLTEYLSSFFIFVYLFLFISFSLILFYYL